jgi:hypothetical protein
VQNVPDCLYDFVENIRPTLKVDNEPFTWDGHEYLIEPYRALADTREESPEGLKMVLQCGAQVGKTVFGFLFWCGWPSASGENTSATSCRTRQWL